MSEAGPPEPPVPPAAGAARDRRLARLAVGVNLAMLALWPLAWVSPLAEAGFLPWFGGSTLSVAGAVGRLWEVDPALAVLVALFGMALPYAKVLALGAIHLRLLGPRALGTVEALGRLAMADVFLIALYIALAKGVGVGYVETAWGLWLFTGCVLASLWAGRATSRIAARRAPR
jgi:uncharacterized paraquat-inducible protein A